MSSNIYEDPNVTVSYSKGVRGDGGGKVERVVDIYESADITNDRHVDYSTQDGGAHVQKRLSIVQRNSFRAAALVLGFLLVAAVIVLSKLYISNNFEKHRLSNSLKQLQTAYEELNTRPRDSLCNSTGWTRFGCSCYFKSTEMKNWTASRKDCQDSGADLVTINSKEEQEFLWKLNKHGDSWVGLRTVKKNWKPGWEWVDTSGSPYLGWHKEVNTNPLEGSTGYIDQRGTLQHTNNGSKQWICEKQIP